MSVPILDYFESAEIKENLQTHTFKKGETILRPYIDTNYVYVIKQGLVKIYDKRGNEKIAVIYGPGYMFPIAWIINKKRPAVYFQALTKGSLYLIPQQFFEEQLKQKTDLSFDFIQSVLEQFALYASTVHSLGYKYGRERIAYRLLVLSALFGEKKNGAVELPHLNHDDLGATVNMTRESVSKEISKFEKLGIIEYNRSNITIKDLDSLRHVLGEDTPIILFDNF